MHQQMTVKGMIDRLTQEQKELLTRLSGFEVEVQRAKQKHISLGQAVAILAKKYSEEKSDSSIDSKTYEEIMQWLNQI